MMVMEYVPKGALLDTLIRSRCYDSHSPNEMMSFLRKDQMFKFMSDIATGMEFMTNLKIIHRDLATRNILVAEDGTLKISDFGFSRDISRNGRYRKLDGGYFPVEWMAIESLVAGLFTVQTDILNRIAGLFTVQTDIWSYGVVLWEIFSLGDKPYPQLKRHLHVSGTVPYRQLVEWIENGYRMERPQLCPEEVYELMQACWSYHSNERPSFTELRLHANAMLENSMKPSKYFVAIGRQRQFKFFKMAERSPSFSGETLPDLCARKKRLQKKMTKGYYLIGAKEDIGMFKWWGVDSSGPGRDQFGIQERVHEDIADYNFNVPSEIMS